MPKFNVQFLRQLTAEFLASFIYIFIVAGTTLNVTWTANQKPTLGQLSSNTNMAAFLTVLAMIFSFGQISGAQMNPVFTAGLMFAMKQNWIVGIIYIVLQFLAAFAALGLLLALFPVSPAGTLGNAKAMNLYIPPPLTEASYWFGLICANIFLVYGFLFMYYDSRPGKVREDMTNKEKYTARKARLRHLIQQTLVPVMMAFVYGFTVVYQHPWRSLASCLIAKDCGIAWVWNVAGFLSSLVAALLWMFINGAGQKAPKCQLFVSIPQGELETCEDIDEPAAQPQQQQVQQQPAQPQVEQAQN